MTPVSPAFLLALSKPVDVSICSQCNHPCERENTPWNHEWRCNGQHKRCTMIGCVPVLK